MTSRDDLERLLYRAITNNRLGARTHTVANALKALSGLKEPWTAAGVSRETWRRWNLPPDAKNAQKPSARHQAGLLAVLRHMRLPKSHAARIRESTGVHVHGTDNYEEVERDLGRSTFDWTPEATNGHMNAIMDAYLLRGIGAAVDAWLTAAPKTGGWAAEWLHPDSNDRSTSIDADKISLTGDPTRAGRSRTRRR